MCTRKHLIWRNWTLTLHLACPHKDFRYYQVTFICQRFIVSSRGSQLHPAKATRGRNCCAPTPHSMLQQSHHLQLLAHVLCEDCEIFVPSHPCSILLCYSAAEKGVELFCPTQKYFLWGLRKQLALPAKVFKELGKGRLRILPSVHWVWWAEQPVLHTSLTDIFKWTWMKSAAVRRAEGTRESGQKH